MYGNGLPPQVERERPSELRTVLLVEDEPEAREILSSTLASGGYRVKVAASARQALAQVEEEKPDAIFLNISLPDMDSAQLCQYLRSSPALEAVPIILWGTLDQREGKELALRCGAEDFIPRDADPQQMVVALEGYLPRWDKHAALDPLTLLPRWKAVEQAAATALQKNRPQALLSLAPVGLRALTRAYGPDRRDQVLQLLGQLIREAASLFGTEGDVASYRGGEEFVLLTTSTRAQTLAQRLSSLFSHRAKDLYDPEDLARGYLEAQDARGHWQRYPFLTLAIGIASSQEAPLSSLPEALKAAQDRRRLGTRRPPRILPAPEAPHAPRASPAPRVRGKARAGEEKMMNGFRLQRLELPVTTLDLALGFLYEEAAARLNPSQLTRLESAREQVRLLLDSLADLKAWQRAGKGLWDIELEEIDLGETLSQSQKLFQAQGKQVRLEIVGIPPGTVLTDGEMVLRAIFLFLRSEMEAAPVGGKVTLEVQEENGRVRLETFNINRLPGPRAVGETETTLAQAQRMWQALGGTFRSKKGPPPGAILLLPRRWRSPRDKLKRLQTVTEAEAKVARLHLKRLGEAISRKGPVSPEGEKALAALESAVQKLEVHSHRLALLADELAGEEEASQETSLQMEADQLSLLEAMLNLSRQTPGSALAGSRQSQQVARLAVSIAAELGLPRPERRAIFCAALLKDLAIPPSLEEAEELSPQEEALLRDHPIIAAQAFSGIGFMAQALPLIMAHHESYDGSGYPRGLRGRAMPLGARILTVAEAYVTLVSELSYMAVEAPQRAKEEIVAASGERFDPVVVNAFLRARRQAPVEFP